MGKKSFYDSVETFMLKIDNIGVWISSICLFVMMFIGVADVICAKLFNFGIPSVYEFMAVLNVPLVFLAIGFVTLERGHMTINVIENKTSEKTKAIMNLNGIILSVFISAFMSWRSIVMFIQHITCATENQGSVRFPLWPVSLSIVIGCILLTIGFCLVLIKDIWAFKAVPDTQRKKNEG
jgi:TRAP-type C4-dicarboxylate transport system permease small subunit